MPTKEEKLAIEQQKMGVRVVDSGGEVISGSYYLLYPVNADWDARLLRTCGVIAAASKPEKRLHVLINTPGVSSGTFGEADNPTFDYGRLVGCGASSLADAGLFGSEKAEDIRGFILRQVASLAVRQPATSTVTQPATGSGGLAAAFSACCTQIAYVFSCCSPSYRQLAEDSDEVDLT